LLRDRFFARKIHASYESWKERLHETLLLNIGVKADEARWSKSQLEPEEDMAGRQPDSPLTYS